MTRKKSVRAVVGVAVATALTAGIPAAANGRTTGAAAQDSPAQDAPSSASSVGYPTFVHLPADQVAHPKTENEWWYTAGHFTAHGHQYGYLVQLTAQGFELISLTDDTTRQYIGKFAHVAQSEVSVSSTQLDVRLPDGTLSGSMNDMHLTAQLGQGRGSLDLHLHPRGPVMYDNGTGLFPFLGGSSYYYSLPNEQTTGTLTLDGRTSTVTGQSWLDRQWGDWDFNLLHKWTWMGVQLSDHQYLNLWDMFDNTGEHAWATVLHPDGSESVVSIEPLAPHAGNFQTDTATGQHFAGKWLVRIPSLNTRLTVTASMTLQDFSNGVDEADSTVTGTYEGKHVTGIARAEQYGDWQQG